MKTDFSSVVFLPNVSPLVGTRAWFLKELLGVTIWEMDDIDSYGQSMLLLGGQHGANGGAIEILVEWTSPSSNG